MFGATTDPYANTKLQAKKAMIARAKMDAEAEVLWRGDGIGLDKKIGELTNERSGVEDELQQSLTQK